MDPQQIAAALREIADWLDFQDANAKFRARAYRTGADTIESASDVPALVRDKRLAELPGIGASIAAHITELYETGRSSQLEKLRGELPNGLLAVREQSGLSPQKVLALYAALDVVDIDSLKAAISAQRIRDVKGFSDKAEEKITAALAKHVARGAEVIRSDALSLAAAIAAHMAPLQIMQAGTLRRGAETIAMLDFVADGGAAALDRFESFPRRAATEHRDVASVTLRLVGGLKARLVVAPAKSFGTALFVATGSDEHVRAIEARLPPGKTFADEAALYRAAELSIVPPELREGSSIDEGRDLVTYDDIKGMVHCHTVYSDGKHTVAEMAEAADALGLSYLTITDHSPTAHYAGGLDIDRLRRQWDEIAAVQEKVKVKLLRGTESDITRDGALDYPDEILEQLDVVIASVHSRHQLDRAQMTERLVRAMRHPIFKIWGHALGRLLLNRAPFDCDIDAVFDAIAESRAAIEVNGDPHRIDLPPALIPDARKRGIKFVISVDAHSVAALDYLQYGVSAARRGGLRRNEVLNTLSAKDFARAVRPS